MIQESFEEKVFLGAYTPRCCKKRQPNDQKKINTSALLGNSFNAFEVFFVVFFSYTILGLFTLSQVHQDYPRFIRIVPSSLLLSQAHQDFLRFIKTALHSLGSFEAHWDFQRNVALSLGKEDIDPLGSLMFYRHLIGFKFEIFINGVSLVFLGQ